jgi:ATP-dependent protease ClpP protease subunit
MTRGARPLRSTRRLQNLHGAPTKWWKIENKGKSDVPTLVSIYDEIGFYGISAGEFLAELSGINGDLDVHISSPGGDVFDAIAIYNQLKSRRGSVAITIDGLAASAASFIAQAASPGMLEMAPFSTMMIHDGFAAGIGNAADMRDLANQLDAASDNIASIYAERTGKSADYWRAKMKSTTWYKDSEAVADGLADRISGQDDPKNTWDLSVFNVDAAGETDVDSAPSVPGSKKKKTKGEKQVRNADVDTSTWDAAKAWHGGTTADDPEAFYRAITAGEKTSGDPSTQAHWALPYRYTPDSPPNAAGVRNALARLSQTQDLKNADAARSMLEGLMKKINPDYSPDDSIDYTLMATALRDALKGGN